MTACKDRESLAAAIKEAIEKGNQGLTLDLQSFAGRQDELDEVTELLERAEPW